MFKQRSFQKWILSGAGLTFGLLAAVADAAGTNQLAKSSGDLENFTLEQLVNVKVTSVSKKETDLFTSPAAIYVITAEDIRRSGMTSIPELLRMVPGLQVARIDANGRAVIGIPAAAHGMRDERLQQSRRKVIDTEEVQVFQHVQRDALA